MCKSIQLLLCLCLLSFVATSQTTDFTFEKTTNFYPQFPILDNENIEWGYFTVPENWENKTGKKIKLAVAILRKTSTTETADPIVMIEGGPGAGGLEGIWYWLNNPLREQSDVILLDLRGTGSSEPRLCPNLGKEFLKILAKNQSATQDEEEKAVAAMACKQQLIANRIDITAYHSASIAQDLHALKTYFKFPNWNVYGVSYGTHIAQRYADYFPNDVENLILDSPISDIREYYEKNTSNYVSSLNKVFEACANDPSCNSEYPDLEHIYYETIEQLSENPITVDVEKYMIPEGTFTYNAEDFKIAIHQALYQKKLIEVLPLLIYQFHDANEDALSALVAAFASSLGLDYGMYYCVSCAEAVPNNSLAAYEADAQQFEKLKGGLSFYKSDFVVCEQWNDQLSKIIEAPVDTNKVAIPTLIYTGEFDPITPVANGLAMVSDFEQANLVSIGAYGHASSFSKPGFDVTKQFIDAPNQKVSHKDFKATQTISFANNIYLNGGISKLGNNISQFNILLFAPLIIALGICLIAFFTYLISFFKNKKQSSRILKLLIALNSILGISVLIGFVMALRTTAFSNFYLLAFGLPEDYSYLFTMLSGFLMLLLVSIAFFFFKVKKMENRSVVFTVLFSNVLIAAYFFHWGIIF